MEHSSFPMPPPHQQQLISWKPFSLTYITYPILVVSDSSNSNATSNVSLLFLPQLMALLSLFPIFFISSLTTCTIVYKDMVAAFLLLGTLLIALLTSCLKKMIGQPRPPSHRDDDDYEMEYGMPSNHSSVAFFGATFIILYVLYYHHQRRRYQQRHWQRIEISGVGIGRNELMSTATSSATMNGNSSTVSSSSSSFQSLVSIAVRWLYYQLHTTIPLLSSLCIASGCAYSRVYLHYHTWNQVIAGSLLGIGGGILWFALFRMEIVQENLAWLDGMIQELELERNVLTCDDDDDNGTNERKKK